MRLLVLFLILNIGHEIFCENTNKDTANPDEVDHFVEETQFDENGRPVKVEIIGDTTHLFADEDFEKKQVVLLGDDELKAKKDHLDNIENETSNNLDHQILDPVKNISFNDEHSDTNKSMKCIFEAEVSRYANSVQIVNGSVLTKHLSNSKDNECFLVLFFVPWCPFSVSLAPIYNALPRAFLNLDVFAFDVSKSIGYNTKFGTSAVPMIIIFQQKNIIAKFNYTNKNLSDYIEFVSNHTSTKGNGSIEMEPQDFEGPVPTVAVKYFDFYLLISWIFLIFVIFEQLLRKTELKSYIVKSFKYLFIKNRLMQVQQGPQRHMIQNEEHEHND